MKVKEAMIEIRKEAEKTRKEEKNMSKMREMLMATITTNMEPKP